MGTNSRLSKIKGDTMIKKLIAAALLCPTASGALAFEFEGAEAGISYSKLEFTDYPDGYKFKEGYITAAGWFTPKLGVQIGYNHGFIKGDYDNYDFDSVQIHGLWQQSEPLGLGVMGAHEKYDGWHYNHLGLEALYTPGRWKIECRSMPAVAKPTAMAKAGAMTDSTWECRAADWPRQGRRGQALPLPPHFLRFHDLAKGPARAGPFSYAPHAHGINPL